ncbi:MAG: rRNA maturation RNase YbeY [Bacteroidota bacterium]
MDAAVQFFVHEIDFKLPAENSVRNWILRILSDNGKTAGAVSYIFCSDTYLLELNKAHLDHDYFTDILTFPYSSPEDLVIQSEIYISIDRVQENASHLKVPFGEELHRVMIHGILHLLGHDDHGQAAQEQMRLLEDQALLLRDFLDSPI